MKTGHRHQSRFLAIQALYSWEVNHLSAITITQQLLAQQPKERRCDTAYFNELVIETINQIETLDGYIKPYVSRPFAELDLIEKAILRVATYELYFRREIPFKVIINEAIELAKSFATNESHRFVNGVLDKIVQNIKTSL